MKRLHPALRKLLQIVFLAAWLLGIGFIVGSKASIAEDERLQSVSSTSTTAPRVRLLIDDDWRFTKNDPPNNTVSLLYDVRPKKAAANHSTDAATVAEVPPAPPIVKSWIIPSGNAFLKDPTGGPKRPAGNLGEGVAYVAPDFDDSAWRQLNLPTITPSRVRSTKAVAAEWADFHQQELPGIGSASRFRKRMRESRSFSTSMARCRTAKSG
jgi:hypothetical protein